MEQDNKHSVGISASPGESRGKKEREKMRSYCLIQLKSSEPHDISDACKTFLGIYGVVAATALNGMFDVILKIEATHEETGRAIDDIRSFPHTEFVTSFEATQIYASLDQLVTKSAIFS